MNAVVHFLQQKSTLELMKKFIGMRVSVAWYKFCTEAARFDRFLGFSNQNHTVIMRDTIVESSGNFEQQGRTWQ